MKEFMYKNKDRIFNGLILLIYIFITLASVINHEAYENEGQSFLIARDLSFPQIIAQMRYEGHSFLWLFVIAPFAKLGLPMQVQNFISWGLCLATVILILKKTKINKLLKVLFIFSSGLLYFYSTIARTYSMIPLLLVLISIIYPKRDEHPYMFATLVALLANTHLIMLPTACLLVLFYWGKKIITKNITIKKKDFYLSLMIAIISILIFTIIILLSLNSMELVKNNMNVAGINNRNILFNKVVRVFNSFVDFLWGSANSPVYVKILFVISLILCVIGIKDNVEQGIIFFVQFIFNFVIHAFFWITIVERVCVIIYTLMFWILNVANSENTINKSENKKVKHDKALFVSIAAIILIGISTYSTFKVIYDDINGNFSVSKDFAKYIENNIEEGSTIICTFNTQFQPIIGYLPKGKYKFFLSGPQREVTFVTWDEKWNEISTREKLSATIDNYLNDNNKVYVLSNGAFVAKNRDEYDCKKLLDTKSVTLLNIKYNFVEDFCLYEVKSKI